MTSDSMSMPECIIESSTEYIQHLTIWITVSSLDSAYFRRLMFCVPSDFVPTTGSHVDAEVTLYPYPPTDHNGPNTRD